MSGDSSRTLLLPDRRLPLDRVLVMGILNATPDSFYDRGRHFGLDRAIARATTMAEEGAEIIDVGGEKAGPGKPVSPDEEKRRVVPIIDAVRRELGLPISVDTFKPEVARAAVEAGAGIINSIGGFRVEAMRRTAVDTGAAIVVMHIQGEPRVANPNPQYDDVVGQVAAELAATAQECTTSGIQQERIIIDPGPGFGKTASHDIQLMRHLDRLTALPFPLLLAVSRKGFIGEILNAPVEDRLEGSLALAAWGVLKGVRIIRCHDVKETVRVTRMTEAVLS